MLRVFVFLFAVALATPVLAVELEKSTSSDPQNEVNVEIVVQDTLLDINLKGPLKLFLGFSRFPETAREKNIWNNYRKQWEDNFARNVTLPDGIKCERIDANAEISIDLEEYVEVGQYKNPDGAMVGQLQLVCDQSLDGKSVTLNFLKSMFRGDSVNVNLVTSAGRNEIMKISRNDVSLDL